ncbi:unnamed protein product [Adineta steineri]|uniref:Protein kinase domain-containing protein n=1 Tax=Adineta steineri TaxID=433720 RepID=A0A815S7E7_9BILA|nr:unnamed protein product [Adineta steineri]CAF1489715.1 unnamed protein product [Adineta steineri]CAF3968449.1 unnamed protein product [Adineta steineri]
MIDVSHCLILSTTSCLTHFYSGTIVTSDVVEYCIHVTNLPNDVTGEELSNIFRVDVVNILIRPYNELQNHLAENQRIPVEVWIKDIGSKAFLQTLAEEKNESVLRGFSIQCQVIPAPVNHFELCQAYRRGRCPFSISCRKKHIRCVQPVNCPNTQCWYGHDAQRPDHFRRPPISDEGGYRVRISNFPPDATRSQICSRLWLRFFRDFTNLVTPNENDPSAPMIAYATDERSSAFVKELIHAWHNQPFSKDPRYRMKCQLEMNVNYYNSTIGTYHLQTSQQWQSPTPSIISSVNSVNSGKKRLSMAYNGMRRPAMDTLFSIEYPEQDQQSALPVLPHPWSFNDQFVSNQTDAIYSIVDQADPNRRAQLKIYSVISDRSSQLRVERHRLALQRLAEVKGIPKLIDCNFEKSTINSNSWTKLWLMTERPEGTRLDNYLRDNLLTFKEKMMIILELIDLVKEIHQCDVVHRNLTPSKIYLHPLISADDEKEFGLQLVDFDFAHLPRNDEVQKTNDINLLQIDDAVTNTFYLPVQFETQPLNNNDIDKEKEPRQSERQSPVIDTSCICAILFWMITFHEPKVARDATGKAPHRMSQSSQLIKDALKLATNSCSWKIHSMENHLQLIFDRAFGNPQQQWSVDALKYQIRFLVEVLNSMKEQNITIKCRSIHELNEPFLRVASLISRMKEEFVSYSSRFVRVHWSSNENNQWSGHSRAVQNYDLLSIDNNQLEMKFEANRSEKEDQLQISAHIKINESTIVELPIGRWQENEIETIIEIFIRELSSFYHLLLE